MWVCFYVAFAAVFKGVVVSLDKVNIGPDKNKKECDGGSTPTSTSASSPTPWLSPGGLHAT